MGGTFLARPGEMLWFGTSVFPARVSARSWALVPAGSFRHFVDSLNFCTTLASWKLFQLRHFDRPILWHFLLRWVCQAEVTCASRAPSTVLPQSNPRAPVWAAAMLANLAVFSPSFYSEQMCSWVPWGCSLNCLHGGKKSLSPRWAIIVELYEGIEVFVPSSGSSFGDKVTSSPPDSHLESTWGN